MRDDDTVSYLFIVTIHSNYTVDKLYRDECIRTVRREVTDFRFMLFHRVVLFFRISNRLVDSCVYDSNAKPKVIYWKN